MNAPKLLLVLSVFALVTAAAAEDVFIHFEGMNVGDNVAGMGTMHPFVDIQPLNAFGDLSVIQTFYVEDPTRASTRKYVVYKAPNRNTWDKWNTNNALEDVFGDVVDSQRADFVEGMTANGFANTDCSWLNFSDPYICPQEYAISFGDRRVYKFKMLMVDYGDFNPNFGEAHQVYLRGYENGLEVSTPFVIDFTTDPDMTPRWCSLGFDPKVEADACECQQSGLGHIHMEVHAPPGSSGLDRIELQMGEGWDPNVAFDSISIGFVNLIDVCPGLCPNRLCRDGSESDSESEGAPKCHDVCGCTETLQVAVLGTGEFDVWDVDSTTCVLNGVPADGWDYGDVSRPYVGDLADQNSCTTGGPDGYSDLTLEFNREFVAATLSGLPDGALAKVELVCTLTSGVEFRSEDIVLLAD